MARAKDTHLIELAKRGAQARLQELIDEVKLLGNLFPDLRDSIDQDELPLSFLIAKRSGQLKKQASASSHRRMSAAERRAASARMKKYWAAKRKSPKG
jgi:hypothetical protein